MCPSKFPFQISLPNSHSCQSGRVPIEPHILMESTSLGMDINMGESTIREGTAM